MAQSHSRHACLQSVVRVLRTWWLELPVFNTVSHAGIPPIPTSAVLHASRNTSNYTGMTRDRCNASCSSGYDTCPGTLDTGTLESIEFFDQSAQRTQTWEYQTHCWHPQDDIISRKTSWLRSNWKDYYTVSYQASRIDYFCTGICRDVIISRFHCQTDICKMRGYHTVYSTPYGSTPDVQSTHEYRIMVETLESGPASL